MSTQSGIEPTEGLLDAFKSFLSERQSILTAYIIEETIELAEIINDLSIKDSIISLKSKLNDSNPQYILIKNDTDDDLYTFIAYVPDYAAVKDKMLYASSKNSLIRNLGSEYFSNVLFWNDLSEVDYESWIHSITSDSSKISLSNEEKELEKLKNLELNTALSQSSKKKLINHSNEFSFKFHENTNDLELNEGDLLSFNIELPNEEIFLSNTEKISNSNDIPTKISSDFPQFNLLKFKNKNYFIYSCPSGSKVKERMIYASNKQGVINHFKEIFNSIEKSIEIGDPIELELSEFNDENSNNNKTSKVAFARPSRPGRRR